MGSPVSIIKRYSKKPEPVEAVLLTRDNVDMVAIWCGGVVTRDAKTSDPTDVYVYLTAPTVRGGMHVDINEYLMKTTEGKFLKCKKDQFEDLYSEVGKRTEPHPRSLSSNGFANQRDGDL